MGRAQSETYSSLFNKSDNVNVDETFVLKSVLVHVLNHMIKILKFPKFIISAMVI